MNAADTYIMCKDKIIQRLEKFFLHHRREIRLWAYKNAYMLIFLSAMFFISWIIIFVIASFYANNMP